MAEDHWGNASSSPGSSQPQPQPRGREWELLEKMVMSSVEEQRRSRRWSTFLWFAWMIMGGTGVDKAGIAGSHTAMVVVSGEISEDAEANADAIIEGLHAAFEAPKSKAVILRINSPGGSPVQSAYVYDEIRRLRSQHKDKKVYAVITDMGASGAYYIASAADHIYVNPGSLVGSIGVIMQGFGVQGLMQKMGVEDRTLTAGEHKAILSPFEPMKPEEIEHVKNLLDAVHQQFISAVKLGRGQRLKDEPQIFSGLFWTGQQAVNLGLADGFGSVDTIARTVVGAEDIVDYSKRPDPLSGLFRRLGTSMGKEIAFRLSPDMQLR
jgi:protease-4